VATVGSPPISYQLIFRAGMALWSVIFDPLILDFSLFLLLASSTTEIMREGNSNVSNLNIVFYVNVIGFFAYPDYVTKELVHTLVSIFRVHYPTPLTYQGRY